MRVERIGDATLYLGDCRDILPTLDTASVIVTDPPYGIGFRYDGFSDRPEDYADLISAIPADHPRAVLQYPEEMMRHMVPLWGAPDDVFVWCYNSNLPRQSRLWGFWGVQPNWDLVRQSPKNAVSKVADRPVRSYDWCSDINLVKGNSLEKEDHPCQLPLALADRIVRLVDAQVVADPFMGSGTIGVASVNIGRGFIGVERSPAYFDIACRRIDEAYKQPQLFGDEMASARQEALL